MRYIELTHVGFRAHVKVASRIVSYRIVLTSQEVTAGGGGVYEIEQQQQLTGIVGWMRPATVARTQHWSPVDNPHRTPGNVAVVESAIRHILCRFDNSELLLGSWYRDVFRSGMFFLIDFFLIIGVNLN